MNKPLRIASLVVLFLSIFGLGQMVLFPVPAGAQAETCGPLNGPQEDCDVWDRDYQGNSGGANGCCWVKTVYYDCDRVAANGGEVIRVWRQKKLDALCDPNDPMLGCPISTGGDPGGTG